ncbi:beta-hydroxyacid dehydrogenase, 3-hydroxyisobutyrate dehydrogenase [Desulfosporosinus orientis DSM 765]|uniref:Beta-hydroxyacid dehydrogenase, 3-hydroxyisobutyrate dehydrogenase n=1 Tax=Desulfosporosinus orientis (strain ATCC 19365 / DSM 765 / NCIMB 8382 / VKM B-1628 / Singapore I) TaxID=768706 RepID=G7W7U0_DESOD|nr:NAD(P)-dependent oxidoreductase [Desulfosporosinus orientis]AET66155.1 beta-hydroxyacid dehydrogenase, 3-hydroxyisobutyrate dehydrogenase [Desulfosporosinus orientis DSM 765]
MKVGFIGIGAMGKPMAQNILRAGYSLYVNDVNEAALQELVAEGAKKAENPRELAREVDVVITMLPNGAVVEQVLLGEQGIFAGAKPGFTVIDMSSVGPTFTQKMAKLASDRQVGYMDAPVSGGVKGAEAGTLTIMVGGEKELVQRYHSLLEVMGKKIYHVGKTGAGDAVKIVNNLLLGINMAAAAEAFVLGTKLGLDPQVLLEIISVSSGSSYALTAKMPNFIFKGQFEAGFAIDLQYKDLELAVQTAKEAKIPMLLTNVAQQVFEQARAAGLGRDDISAVIKPLEDLMKIKVRA